MPLHPEVTALIALLDDWQKENGVPARTGQNFPEQRHWGRVQFPLKKTIEERSGVSVEKQSLATRDGERPVRVYRPEGGDALPTLVFVHGGGYAVGGLDDVHHEALRLAVSVPANVVSISYRLAPEHPWPAGIEDGEDLIEAIANGAISGIQTTRLGFGGISAGAGLAAAVTQRLLAKGHSPIALLFLMSPWLDMTQTLPSSTLYGRGHILERSGLDLFIEAYRGKDGLVEYPEFSPARHPVPSDWPATVMLSAECDPLADDAALFARRLAEADIPHVWRVARGMTHAFHAWVGQIPSATVETDWMDARIRDGLAKGIF
jgi:acetyl esterase